MNIKKAIELLELDLIDEEYEENILLWEQYYQGNVVDFHTYSDFDGEESVEKERLSLQMAKKVCEDWADYLWNPEAKITVNENYQDILEDVLNSNKFSYRFNESLELGFAQGTMAIELKLNNNKVYIDFIRAGHLKPVYDGNKFAWLVYSRVSDNAYHITLHNEVDELNNYKIENFIIEIDDANELVLIDENIMLDVYGLISEIEYKSSMLAIIKPAIANNINYDTDYGISIFANALAELRTIDQAYTSLDNEVEQGQLISFVTAQDLKTVEGKSKFPNSKRFYKLEGDATFENGLSRDTHSPTLRTPDFIDALETNLNLCGRKVGFGDNAYSMSEGSIYTNTAQVISTNSKFFKTRQKHLVGIKDAVEIMVKAIHELLTEQEYSDEITVEFDDSIIHDKQQEDKELDFQLMNGLISEVYYWQQKLGLTEELATEHVRKMQEQKGLIEMPDDENPEI